MKNHPLLFLLSVGADCHIVVTNDLVMDRAPISIHRSDPHSIELADGLYELHAEDPDAPDRIVAAINAGQLSGSELDGTVRWHLELSGETSGVSKSDPFGDQATIKHLREEFEEIQKCLDDNPSRCDWLCRTAITHVRQHAEGKSHTSTGIPRPAVV